MGLPIASELLSVLLKNKILAWFTILFVLSTDTFLSGVISNGTGAGLTGFILSSVLTSFGLTLNITSFQVLFITAVVPLLLFVLDKS